MNAGEYGIAVLEVEQASQRAASREVAKEPLGRVVRGDARWADQPRTPLAIEQRAELLGEEGVGVEFPSRGQREATALANELRLCFFVVLGAKECCRQCGIRLFKCGDGAFTCIASQSSNSRCMNGEELLLLKLELLPWRVPDGPVEAIAVGEDV